MTTMIKIETNLGAITVELDEKNTPKTAANFLKYVKAGFYDGMIFHRVIKGFMIQAGGFKPGMTAQKPTHPAIMNEADKGGKNVKGAVAMARTDDPHSASAQFFINVADNKFLDHTAKTPQGWGYCVFGQVTEGLDIAEKISKAHTTAQAGHRDVPEENILIQKITVMDNPYTVR